MAKKSNTNVTKATAPTAVETVVTTATPVTVETTSESDEVITLKKKIDIQNKLIEALKAKAAAATPSAPVTATTTPVPVAVDAVASEELTNKLKKEIEQSCRVEIEALVEQKNKEIRKLSEEICTISKAHDDKANSLIRKLEDFEKKYTVEFEQIKSNAIKEKQDALDNLTKTHKDQVEKLESTIKTLTEQAKALETQSKSSTETVSQELTEKAKLVTTLETQLTNLKAEFESLKEVKTKDETLLKEETQKVKDKLTKELSAAQEQLNKYQQQLDESKKIQTAIEAEKKTRIEALEKELSLMVEATAKARSEVANSENAASETIQRLTVKLTELQSLNDSLRHEYADKEKLVTLELQAAIGSLQAANIQREALEKTIHSAELALKNSENNARHYQEQVENLNNALNQERAVIQQREEQYRLALQNAQTSSQTEVATLTRRVLSADNEISTLNRQITDLKQFIEKNKQANEKIAQREKQAQENADLKVETIRSQFANLLKEEKEKVAQYQIMEKEWTRQLQLVSQEKDHYHTAVELANSHTDEAEKRTAAVVKAKKHLEKRFEDTTAKLAEVTKQLNDLRSATPAVAAAPVATATSVEDVKKRKQSKTNKKETAVKPDEFDLLVPKEDEEKTTKSHRIIEGNGSNSNSLLWPAFIVSHLVMFFIIYQLMTNKTTN